MLKRVRLSYWFLGITLIAVAALLLWPAAAMSSLPMEKTVTVATGQAKRGRVEKTLALAGTVCYAQERYAIASQTGLAAWVTSKQEGDTVAAGEPLVRLDTTAQEALLTQAYLKPREPVQVLSQTLNGVSADPAAQLEMQIEACTVRAYETGQVLQMLVRPGEAVQAGAPVALMASQNQQIRISVGVQDRRKLKPGMAVRIQQEGQFLSHGHIHTVGAMMMDTATGLSGAQITVNPTSSLGLSMGDEVEVIAILEAAEQVVTVPLNALDQDGTVWQIHEGRAWPIQGKVRLWDESCAWVEGIPEKTSVILSPPPQLKSGQRIKEAGN